MTNNTDTAELCRKCMDHFTGKTMTPCDEHSLPSDIGPGVTIDLEPGIEIQEVFSEQSARIACDQLNQSDTGRHTLRKVVDWLDGSGVSLDQDNQEAILFLIRAVFGPLTMTARDIMRDTLERTKQ